jgi:sugar porter (SP) family MFS transporter
MKIYVALIAFVAALGGLLFGFDTAVIAGTLDSLKNTFKLDEIRQGWVVSSAILGCIPGALLSGWLASQFGRRPVLMMAAVLYLVSAIWCGVAATEQSLVWARILGGLAIGFASTTAPIYISEIAPAEYRGRLGMLTQLSINIGILLSYVSNYWIDNSAWVLDLWGGHRDALWQPMFAVAAVPSLLFLVGLFLIPESPRWLAMKGKTAEARRVFEKITNNSGETEKLLATVAHENSMKNIDENPLFLMKKHAKVLLTGFFAMIFCLMTGINIVLYYAPLIFEKTKIDMSAKMQTVVTGLVLFFFTILALWLIDRVGRKRLLLIGSWVMAISMLGLSAIFYFNKLDNYGVLILILIYIAAFSITWGSVIWVLVGEMFPNSVRATGTSIANFGNWITNFLLTILFPLMLAKLGGSGTFLFYAVANFVAVAFVYFFIYETKGVALEDMEEAAKKI